MGAGRKTQSYTVTERSQPHWLAHGNPPSWRGLRKGDLGGVIFGCKHSTINECYDKKLFGLPAAHISYVKNIDPGLTLFLFNYSDRKLHGIFVAASHGQLSIDPLAWSGSQPTPFAAQVRIRVRLHCQPLLEDQFRPILAENYFEEKHFWFELDCSQTKKLISLFSPAPVRTAIPASSSSVNTSSSGPLRVHKWRSLFKAPSSDAGDGKEDSRLEVVRDSKRGTKGSISACNDPLALCGTERFETGASNGDAQKGNLENLSMNTNFGQPYASGLEKSTSSLAQKKWSALFKDEASSHASKEAEDLRISALEVKPLHLDNLAWDYTGKDAEDFKAPLEVNACYLGQCNLPPDQSSISPGIEGLMLFEDETNLYGGKEDAFKGSDSDLDDKDRECSSFQPHLDGLNRILENPMDKEELKNYDEIPHSNNNNLEWGSSCILPDWDDDNYPWDIEEQNRLKSTCTSSHVSAVTGDAIDDNGKVNERCFTDSCHQEAGRISEMNSSSPQSLVAKLLLEVDKLISSQLKLTERINSLELELVESRKEIQCLKTQCTNSNTDNFIFLVGGFDGFSWLSTLDSYSLSKDTVSALCPMSSVRSYASATIQCGELFILGGMNGDLLCNTVESYNQVNNEWVRRPSLNQKKGNLAGVSLIDKIFAIGGGNGVQSFSEVEMLDLDIGKWILTRSMLHQRFAPAAAEINGVLYAVGGYDGTDYLDSVERFDPREASWMRLKSMDTKRGCHSVVVLHEKLYAIGGHNGHTMVPTVEVFDPRAGSWRMDQSLNQARGCFGAVVIGDAIYVMGGVKDEQEVLDTVECYRAGYGWQLTNRNGIGKRSFFSAVAL